MNFWTTLFGCVSVVIKSGEGQAAHTLLPQWGDWSRHSSRRLSHGAGIEASRAS